GIPLYFDPLLIREKDFGWPPRHISHAIGMGQTASREGMEERAFVGSCNGRLIRKMKSGAPAIGVVVALHLYACIERFANHIVIEIIRAFQGRIMDRILNSDEAIFRVVC